MKLHFIKKYFLVLVLISAGCSSFQSSNNTNRVPAQAGAGVIPEVFNLADNQAIPDSVYASSSLVDIARSAVARIEAKEMRSNCAGFNYRDNTVIQMRFRYRDLASIQRGGFQNVHQNVGLSPQKQINARQRDEVESRLLRLRFSNENYSYNPQRPSNVIRPKYAYLGFRTESGIGRTSDFIDYGNVVAVFKDSIKGRSTFTVADSLATYYATGSIQNYSFNFCESQELRATGSYWEAQIYGPLGFSDVEHLLVNCPRTERPLSAADINNLKAQTGLSVFQCMNRDGSHMKKGNQL